MLENIIADHKRYFTILGLTPINYVKEPGEWLLALRVNHALCDIAAGNVDKAIDEVNLPAARESLAMLLTEVLKLTFCGSMGANVAYLTLVSRSERVYARMGATNGSDTPLNRFITAKETLCRLVGYLQAMQELVGTVDAPRDISYEDMADFVESEIDGKIDELIGAIYNMAGTLDLDIGIDVQHVMRHWMSWFDLTTTAAEATQKHYLACGVGTRYTAVDVDGVRYYVHQVVVPPAGGVDLGSLQHYRVDQVVPAYMATTPTFD